MIRVPDGKLMERQLVGEEARCRRRNLTIEQVFADLHRLLGHSEGATKKQRIRDLATALEVGESSIGNVLLRLVPVSDSLLIAMYGDEPCGTLHPDWAADPADWGPILSWGADVAPDRGNDYPPGPKAKTTVSQAAPPAAVASEPEAAIPSPPATIPAPVPLAQAIAEVAAVVPPDAAGDCHVKSDAIAEAGVPIVTDPIASAIDLLRDKLELAKLRQKYCEDRVSQATAAFDAAEAEVMKIEAAIEALQGLGA
jgi:hypothetical protein